MKKQLLLSILFISSFSLFSCASMGGSSEKASYEVLHAKTVAAANKAKSVDGEWRDIRWGKSKIKYIPSAEKAAKAGDYAKAMKLLKIAKFQAEKGYEQAMEQKNAGPLF